MIPLKGRCRGGLTARLPGAGRAQELSGMPSVGTASPCPAAARPGLSSRGQWCTAMAAGPQEQPFEPTPARAVSGRTG